MTTSPPSLLLVLSLFPALQDDETRSATPWTGTHAGRTMQQWLGSAYNSHFPVHPPTTYPSGISYPSNHPSREDTAQVAAPLHHHSPTVKVSKHAWRPAPTLSTPTQLQLVWRRPLTPAPPPRPSRFPAPPPQYHLSSPAAPALSTPVPFTPGTAARALRSGQRR